MVQNQKRIAYLDGIRGIAAIMVFFYHYLLAFFPALFILKPEYCHTQSNIELVIASSPLSIFYSGGFAVCIFFVLSGYVLSHKFFLKGDYEYLASASIKRYFRLSIPIVVSVLISLVILTFNGYSNIDVAYDYTECKFWLANLWDVKPSLFEALKEGIFTSLFVGKGMKYNEVLWTMNIEFMGSLLVFTILALIGKIKRRFFLYAVLILIFYKGFMVAFIMGVALADYYTFPKRKYLNRYLLLALLIPMIYLGSYQRLEGDNLWRPVNFLSGINSIYPYLIATFILMIFILNIAQIKNALSHKIFNFFGKISFSLYLLHVLILGSLSCALFRIFYKEMDMSYIVSFFLMFIISFVVTLVLSYIMYVFIDSNAIKFSNYFYRRFFRDSV